MQDSPVVKASMVMLRLKSSPTNPAKGYEFINAIVGGAIPKEYIPAVDQGIQGAMLSGVLAGYNVVDVKVTLYDGSYHEVDSSEMAFKIAGSMAFKEAMRKADPVILEPIMKVVVIVPEEYMGDVIGDLNSRRGHDSGHGSRFRAHSRSMRWFRCPKCLVMQPTCVPKHRAAASIPWSPRTMQKFRSLLPRSIITRTRAKRAE